MTTYYVKPENGNDANSGTSEQDAFATMFPFDEDGSVTLQPGDVVKVDESFVHSYEGSLTIARVSGTESDPIIIEPLGDGVVEIDRNKMNGHGITFWACDYITMRRFHITNVWQNAIRIASGSNGFSEGMRFEDVETSEYGFADDWGGNGFICFGDVRNPQFIRCSGHHGHDNGDSDAFYVGGNLESGFTSSSYFEDCLAYRNADDGFDFFANDGSTEHVMVRCVAYRNGSDGSGATGDGNGFKLGGASHNTGNVTMKRCVSWGNTRRGIDTNSAHNVCRIINCTTFDNELVGYRFASQAPSDHIVKNCISYQDGTPIEKEWAAEVENSSWTLGISDPGFASITPGDVDFLRLAEGSPAIDAGITADIDFMGDSPDLGAYEYGGTVTEPPEPEPQPDQPTSSGVGKIGALLGGYVLARSIRGE